jgi:hypothetical protein
MQSQVKIQWVLIKIKKIKKNIILHWIYLMRIPQQNKIIIIALIIKIKKIIKTTKIKIIIKIHNQIFKYQMKISKIP